MIPSLERISAGVLINNTQKVFVAQRNDSSNEPLKWEFPGGKLKEDEKYDEALIREFKEEFDIDIEVLKEIGSVEIELDSKVQIFMFFLIKGDYTQVKLLEHKDATLVSYNELKELDLCKADLEFINKWTEDLQHYFNS